MMVLIHQGEMKIYILCLFKEKIQGFWKKLNMKRTKF